MKQLIDLKSNTVVRKNSNELVSSLLNIKYRLEDYLRLITANTNG